jgi:uncharacterized protein involved in exopolysaccharide biosynthesis
MSMGDGELRARVDELEDAVDELESRVDTIGADYVGVDKLREEVEALRTLVERLVPAEVPADE